MVEAESGSKQRLLLDSFTSGLKRRELLSGHRTLFFQIVAPNSHSLKCSWEEDRFQVMVELCDADFAPSVTRYEYFWIEATDLSGRQGAASVDENSEDEMKAWMDSQMNMPWNLHAVDLSCWHENDAMR